MASRLGGARAEVPIVFLTARDATEDKVRGLTSGGDDYVTKPFSLEELIARIRTILGAGGVEEAPAASHLKTWSSTKTPAKSRAPGARST